MGDEQTKLTIKDVVELAKAGYKPSDVKELITLAESKKVENTGDEHQEKTDEKTDEDIQNSEDKKEPEEKSSGSEAESIDYKKLYEESQSKLKEAQAANVKMDISGNQSKTDQQQFDELIRSFI